MIAKEDRRLLAGNIQEEEDAMEHEPVNGATKMINDNPTLVFCEARSPMKYYSGSSEKNRCQCNPSTTFDTSIALGGQYVCLYSNICLYRETYE